MAISRSTNCIPRHQPYGQQYPPLLFKLAYHILSICPNFASCECLFSVFRNTLTKLRNFLGNQTLTSLTELKMHIWDEHVRDGEIKQCMKCLFGAKTSAPSVAPVPQRCPSQQPSTSVTSTSETEVDLGVMDIIQNYSHR